MKRVSFFAIVMLFATVSFAQNLNVQTAYNYYKKGDLKKALEAIQPALENSQTAGQAKTWFYYGNICFDIAKNQTGQYADLLPDPIDEAVRGYTKATELDKEGRYKDDIQHRMAEISAMNPDKDKPIMKHKKKNPTTN